MIHIKILIVSLLFLSVAFANVEFEIFYSDNYAFALDERLKDIDYFPGKNYQRIINEIRTNGDHVFSGTLRRIVHEPGGLNRELLQHVHDAPYVRLLNNILHDRSHWSASWVEDELQFLERASFVNIAEALRLENDEQNIKKVTHEIVRAQSLGSSGTIEAARTIAMHSSKPKAAINLSGGYHHAGKSHPSGFCVMNDVAMAIKEVLSEYEDYKILIVDLDAHLGDGNEEIFRDDERVVIFDIFNRDIFPRAFVNSARERHYRFGVAPGMKDQGYLSLLEKELSKALNDVKPDMVFYNAGTDIYKHDPLGGFKISELGIIKRDHLVFRLVLNENPNARIVMVLSGGYATGTHLPEGAEDIFTIIGRSIINLKMSFGVQPSAPVMKRANLSTSTNRKKTAASRFLTNHREKLSKEKKKSKKPIGKKTSTGKRKFVKKSSLRVKSGTQK